MKTLVAKFDIVIPVPTAPSDVLRLFNEAWGFENGHCSRLPKYKGEAEEYGLAPDSYIPLPEPEGFSDAQNRLRRGQHQHVVLEIYSDGERRIRVT